MTRPVLLVYQCAISISDTATGALLVIAPQATLRLMGLRAPDDAQPYVGFIGAFVLSVGLSCLYGALVMACDWNTSRLEMVWLLTAIARASVALFVASQILTHALAAGWATVALTDGACVVIQGIGLRKGWLANASR